MEILIVIFILYVLLKGMDLYYEKNWAKKLSVEVHFDREYAEVGDTVSLEEVVINNKSIPLPYLNLKFETRKGIRFPSTGEEEKISDKVYRNDIISLLFHQKITRKLPVNCEKRGVYKIVETQVVSDSFLFTHVMAAKYPQNIKLTVFPQRIMTEGIDTYLHTVMGDHIVPKRLYEDPFEFSGIREYQSYDTLSSINWNATARSGRLQVNQHDETADKTVYLILNVDHEGMLRENDLHELGISIAAGLSYYYLQAGYQLGMISNGKDAEHNNIPFYSQSDGMEQFGRVNTGLAMIDLDQECESLVHMLGTIEKENFNQATIIYISPKRVNNCYHFICNEIKNHQDNIWIETYHEGNTCKTRINIGMNMGEEHHEKG